MTENNKKIKSKKLAETFGILGEVISLQGGAVGGIVVNGKELINKDKPMIGKSLIDILKDVGVDESVITDLIGPLETGRILEGDNILLKALIHLSEEIKELRIDIHNISERNIVKKMPSTKEEVDKMINESEVGAILLQEPEQNQKQLPSLLPQVKMKLVMAPRADGRKTLLDIFNEEHNNNPITLLNIVKGSGTILSKLYTGTSVTIRSLSILKTILQGIHTGVVFLPTNFVTAVTPFGLAPNINIFVNIVAIIIELLLYLLAIQNLGIVLGIPNLGNSAISFGMKTIIKLVGVLQSISSSAMDSGGNNIVFVLKDLYKNETDQIQIEALESKELLELGDSASGAMGQMQGVLVQAGHNAMINATDQARIAAKNAVGFAINETIETAGGAIKAKIFDAFGDKEIRKEVSGLMFNAVAENIGMIGELVSLEVGWRVDEQVRMRLGFTEREHPDFLSQITNKNSNKPAIAAPLSNLQLPPPLSDVDSILTSVQALTPEQMEAVILAINNMKQGKGGKRKSQTKKRRLTKRRKGTKRRNGTKRRKGINTKKNKNKNKKNNKIMVGGDATIDALFDILSKYSGTDKDYLLNYMIFMIQIKLNQSAPPFGKGIDMFNLMETLELTETSNSLISICSKLEEIMFIFCNNSYLNGKDTSLSLEPVESNYDEDSNDKVTNSPRSVTELPTTPL